MNEIEKQFFVMNEMVKGDAKIHDAFIAMTKLLKMMYDYLEDRRDLLSEHDEINEQEEALEEFFRKTQELRI